MIVCFTGFLATGGYFSGYPPTIDGHAMTAITGGDAANNHFQGAIFWADVTGHRGEKPLAWDWGGADALADGSIFVYGFYKGVNLSTPTGDTDGSQDAASPYQTKTITATPGDLIVAWAFGYDMSGAETPTWTNATGVFDATLYVSSDGAVAEKAATGNVSITATKATNWEDGGICALVLKPAI
jgi:hypothetical protein